MAPPRYESADVDASVLGSPLHFAFSGKTAPNRILKAAMTERLSSWDPNDHSARGIPSKELINAYKRWGEGGAGVILTGNVMLYFDQLEARGNPIIPPGAAIGDARFKAFESMAAAAKSGGSLVVAQVSHPGRQVEQGIQAHPISASDVQLQGEVMGMRFAKPRAASTQDIAEIVDRFASVAEYVERAGYDGIQLHSAHGYLLAQFISQTTNKRTDAYGGSVENRARIIADIAREVKRRTRPGFILGIKLNSVEFQEGGFQPAEARELCTILEREQFDFVELSGGTYEQLAFEHKRDSTKKREAFFIEFAEQIVPALKQTKTYVTGGFKTVGAMVDALKTIDGVGLGRPITQEPRIVRDILSGKIKGAIAQIFDQNDFGLTNVVAGSQIRQIGRDQEPVNGSDPQHVDAFKKDMAAWAEAMGADKEQKKYGYVDLDSLSPVPYGAVA